VQRLSGGSSGMALLHDVAEQDLGDSDVFFFFPTSVASFAASEIFREICEFVYLWVTTMWCRLL